MKQRLKRLSLMLIVAGLVAMHASESQACWWWGCYRPAACCYRPCCYRPCCVSPCACGTSPCSCPTGGCATGNCASGACGASLTPSTGIAFMMQQPVTATPVRTVSAERKARKQVDSRRPLQARRPQRAAERRMSEHRRDRRTAQAPRRPDSSRRVMLDARLTVGTARG